jgi:hypothetical protein
VLIGAERPSETDTRTDVGRPCHDPVTERYVTVHRPGNDMWRAQLRSRTDSHANGWNLAPGAELAFRRLSTTSIHELGEGIRRGCRMDRTRLDARSLREVSSPLQPTQRAVGRGSARRHKRRLWWAPGRRCLRSEMVSTPTWAIDLAESSSASSTGHFPGRGEVTSSELPDGSRCREEAMRETCEWSCVCREALTRGRE